MSLTQAVRLTILMQVWGCWLVGEQGHLLVFTTKPGYIFPPCKQSNCTHEKVNVGRHFGVPPPPSAAKAGRERMTGAAQVMAPAAAAFVRKSRRFIDDRSVRSTMSGD